MNYKEIDAVVAGNFSLEGEGISLGRIRGKRRFYGEMQRFFGRDTTPNVETCNARA